MPDLALQPIGIVRSPLTTRKGAPRQPDEGAPPASIHVDVQWHDGLEGIAAGDRVVVLTWLHQADRTTLQVLPRGERGRQLHGVFSTRSPDRPNPIGLHEVTVTRVEGLRLDVDGIEAVDGTPVLDIKPALACRIEDR
jgi:tRNA-Thr(GGU) m(6)t(6)A37 methyltransferase TsaA